MQRLYLPHLTNSQPKLTEPHLPILCSAPEILKKARRVIVVLQDPAESWLMWSRNTVTTVSGIEAGSPIVLAKAIDEQYDGDVGLIVMNPCQLLYSYESGAALSSNTWRYRPNRSAVHSEREVVIDYNRIPGNNTVAKHVEFVFRNVIFNSEYVNPSATFHLIGNNNGCEYILQFLHDNCKSSMCSRKVLALTIYQGEEYGKRMTAIALANCPVFAVQAKSLPFLDFLATRGRIWKQDTRPVDAVIEVPYELTEYSVDENKNTGKYKSDILCPAFSAGVMEAPQDTLTHVQMKILAWFDEVHADSAYENPYLEVEPLPEDENSAAAQGMDSPDWGTKEEDSHWGSSAFTV